MPRVVPLEAAHRFSLGLAFADASGDVGLGGRAAFGSGQDHGLECPVQLTVAAA